MTFPIVVGTGPRHSSCRPFPPAPRRGDNGDDDDDGERGDDAVLLAVGTNRDGRLTATAFLRYHFLPAPAVAAGDVAPRGDDDDDDNDDEDEERRGDGAATARRVARAEEAGDAPAPGTPRRVVAELRVQIRPAAAPFAADAEARAGRETDRRAGGGARILVERRPARRRRRRSSFFASKRSACRPSHGGHFRTTDDRNGEHGHTVVGLRRFVWFGD